MVKYPNHLEVYDPHNQRIRATRGSLQPLARNIATGLSYQCLEKNNDKLSVGILTPDIQVFVASVLLKEDAQLYSRITTDVRPGELYAWHNVSNTREFRDALNRTS